jgi:cation transport protein ChaC
VGVEEAFLVGEKRRPGFAAEVGVERLLEELGRRHLAREPVDAGLQPGDDVGVVRADVRGLARVGRDVEERAPRRAGATVLSCGLPPTGAAMSRMLRLSPDHVGRVHRAMEDPGPLPGRDHFTEAQYDAHLSAFLKERPGGPIGVFAYGSLIWKPVFAPAATRRATAVGWQRAFTLRLHRFRGTPEVPGLMMQITAGGTCEGVLQMIAEGAEWDTLSALWRREMTARPPSYIPRWIEVEADGRMQRVMAFTANPASPSYAGVLDLEEVATCLSQACGHWGSGAEYLYETVIALEGSGVHDPYLWALQDRVAGLIEARFPELSGGA